MDIFKEIQDVLTEILDIEEEEITTETYLVRELDAESIDFLEIAVQLNSKFNVDISDDEAFLRKLRLHLDEAEEAGKDISAFLAEKYPFLSPERISEIMADLDGGPALKVKDVISYINWKLGK